MFMLSNSLGDFFSLSSLHVLIQNSLHSFSKGSFLVKKYTPVKTFSQENYAEGLKGAWAVSPV